MSRREPFQVEPAQGFVVLRSVMFVGPVRLTVEETDRLAPSLKGAGMETLAGLRLSECRHILFDMEDVARTVAEKLPPAERAALEDAMKPNTGGDER